MAIIHEAIHAELFERCFRLGLIDASALINGELKVRFATNPNVDFIGDQLFAELINQYRSSAPNPDEWQHDFFELLNYKNKLIENLEAVHPWLDDSNNPFNPNVVSNGVFLNLNDFLSYLTWNGLSGTQSYQSLTSNEQSKVNFSLQILNSNYNDDCN